MGRPRKPFDEKEAQVVGEAYTLYRFGARMLEVAVRKMFKIRISYNRIHMYLKAARLMKIPRKRSDTSGFDMNGSIACPQNISIGMNPKNSKSVVDQLVERYWGLCPMRELILDHGAEFGAHRVHEDGNWDSEFKKHLERHGIEPILARVEHPQTNGKLERWFGDIKASISFFII